MSGFRTYRGLHGESVRVPEDTIAPAPYSHRFMRYPYAHVAAQEGIKPDYFAQQSLRRSFIDDAAKSQFVREALAAH